MKNLAYGIDRRVSYTFGGVLVMLDLAAWMWVLYELALGAGS